MLIETTYLLQQKEIGIIEKTNIIADHIFDILNN
jgi:hypothetical protein